MIVFETEEDFKAAVVNILKQMSVRLSDYCYGYGSDGIEFELMIDGDEICSARIML